MVDFTAVGNVLDFQCVIYYLKYYVLNSLNQEVKCFNFYTFFSYAATSFISHWLYIMFLFSYSAKGNINIIRITSLYF